ncbi:MAG: PepSY-associated TM helix domain-containing protein, partial [Pseudomonadota bacterium]
GVGTWPALWALLLLISVTGTLLVFKDDYLRATLPEARGGVQGSSELWLSAINLAEERFGKESLRVLVFASDDLGVHKAYLTDGRSAYMSASGEVVARWRDNDRFEDWLFDLHHRLLLGDLGLVVAGLAGLAGSLLVLTGLYAVWPMRLGLRRGLKIAQPTRQQLRSLHRNLGAWIAMPALLLMLSGAALSFPAESRALFDRIGSPVPEPETVEGPGYTDWPAGLAGASLAFPDAMPRMAIWPRDGAPAMVRLKQPAEWHPNGRTYFTFSDAGAAAQDATRLGAGREAYNALYPLHAGKTGSVVYKWMTALFGLCLSLLAFLGLMSFAKRFSRPSLPRPVWVRPAHDPDL